MLTLLLCLSMSGCNAIGLDIESQLRPPKNNGQQEELQTALENYITQNSLRGERDSYLLKYPSSGQYRSAFILLDQAQPPVYVSPSASVDTAFSDMMGNFCLAFYRMDTENSLTHIHLLKKENGSWISMADVEGYGEEIEQIQFADLNGDTIPEVLIGWNLYNAKDSRLTIYSVTPQLQEYVHTDTYTHLVVNDITADGSDDLLLFSLDTVNNLSTVRLITLQNGNFITIDQTSIDPDILSFSHSVNVVFSDGNRGVFVDAYKDPQTTITELLIWKNGRLEAPFYSSESQITSLTARNASLFCNDVDEDGTVEWPMIVEEFDNASVRLWKTAWYYFDPSTQTAKHDFDSLVNLQDRFLLQLTDAFPKDFLTSYDEETRILTFSQNEQPFLKIQTTSSGKKSDLADKFVYFDNGQSLHYAVWKDDLLSITTEEFRYLFSAL